MRGSRRQREVWPEAGATLRRLYAEYQRADARALSLRERLTAADAQDAEVRALERRRLVRAITVTTLRDLNTIRARLWRLRDLLDEGLPADPAMRELAKVRAALDELLDGFRTTVRGIYPAMLPDHGPRAALEELAATLPRPVRFDGDLGRRVDWQIESSLYHAVSAALDLFTAHRPSDPAQAAESPVRVVFGHDDALQARVSGFVGGVSPEQLTAALDHDIARIAVLGGTMHGSVDDGIAIVDIRLTRRSAPPDLETIPPPFEHSTLFRQVWELLRLGRRNVGYGSERSRWVAVAERMTRSPRVAVVWDPAARMADPARTAASEVTLVDVHGPADEALAREFLADDGPRGCIDAVVCRVRPEPGFLTVLRNGRHRVMVAESADGDVTDHVIGRVRTQAPVIAARRALVSLRELMTDFPAEHEMCRTADQIAAEGHEIAELELLDELECGDQHSHRGWRADPQVVAGAVRLLGAHGSDPRTRLGLDPAADEAQVRAAAADTARRWRTRAESPITGGRDRVMCETLARAAERLLGGA